MQKKVKAPKKQKRYSIPVPGASPGIVTIHANARETKIKLYTYTENAYSVKALDSLKDISNNISNPMHNFWIEIKGLKSIELFETLHQELGINYLVLEDISSSYNRPKFEEYDDDQYAFSVSRHLYLDENNQLVNEQISFLLFKNMLITFQEEHNNYFEPVIRRLQVGKGNIRKGGSSYLMYALMDAIVDNYFALLDQWSDELDLIEERLFTHPNKLVMYETQKIKLLLISVRRVAWPERDKLNDIIRSENRLIDKITQPYFRDAYDHCIQIIDLVDSLKEISSSNIDTNISIVSFRLNEIMKVLTVISSIFIPLTFIAGIYGMNFSRIDPVTNEVYNFNMPELYSPNGYLYTLGFMLLLSLIQIIFFWRKGWFK